MLELRPNWNGTSGANAGTSIREIRLSSDMTYAYIQDTILNHKSKQFYDLKKQFKFTLLMFLD